MKKPIRHPVNHIMQSATDVFGPASSFAKRALACLYNNENIKHVHQCSGHWADGYVETMHGELVPFEIKDTLGWGKLCEALVQLVSIRHSLPPMEQKAWIIFEKFSPSWNKNPSGPLNHAIYCASKFHTGIDIYFLHLNQDCHLNPVLCEWKDKGDATLI